MTRREVKFLKPKSSTPLEESHSEDILNILTEGLEPIKSSGSGKKASESKDNLVVYFPIYDAHDENFNILDDIINDSDFEFSTDECYTNETTSYYKTLIMMKDLTCRISSKYLKDKDAVVELKEDTFLSNISILINDEVFIKAIITSRELDYSYIEKEIEKVIYNKNSIANNIGRLLLQQEIMYKLYSNCKDNNFSLISLQFDYQSIDFIEAIAVVYSFDKNRFIILGYNDRYGTGWHVSSTENTIVPRLEPYSPEAVLDIHKKAVLYSNQGPF